MIIQCAEIKKITIKNIVLERFLRDALAAYIYALNDGVRTRTSPTCINAPDTRHYFHLNLIYHAESHCTNVFIRMLICLEEPYQEV